MTGRGGKPGRKPVTRRQPARPVQPQPPRQRENDQADGRDIYSSSANFERWLKLGATDAAARAGEICQRTLAEYEPPPLDDAVGAELADYVARRRAELGD